jgi:hypothetical protein
LSIDIIFAQCKSALNVLSPLAQSFLLSFSMFQAFFFTKEKGLIGHLATSAILTYFGAEGLKR